MALGDKNNIVYEIDCNNYEAVNLSESKWSLKLRSDKHKRSVKNCNREKHEDVKRCREDDNFISRSQLGIKIKLLMVKTGYFLGKSKNICIL